MQHHGFSESDSQARELEEYRSVSPFALIALALGLASVLAVGSPSLWVIPVVAVGFAVWALRDLRRNSTSRVGRTAAVTGLLLALFFAGFASTRVLGDRIVHLRQARQVTEQWFQDIRDQQLPAAYLLMMEPQARSAKMGDIGRFLAEDETFREQMDEQFRAPPYPELIAAAPDFEARYVLCELDAHSNKDLVLQLRYDIHWRDQAKPPTPLIVELLLIPSPLPLAHRDRWHVRRVLPARNS